jgi:hypothetical protein
MAVTDTCNNGWREPRNSATGTGGPTESQGQPTGWSDAQAIGSELESWLEAFTGPRRRTQDLLDLSDLPDEQLPESPHNNWREPLDEVGGETPA